VLNARRHSTNRHVLGPELSASPPSAQRPKAFNEPSRESPQQRQPDTFVLNARRHSTNRHGSAALHPPPALWCSTPEGIQRTVTDGIVYEDVPEGGAQRPKAFNEPSLRSLHPLNLRTVAAVQIMHYVQRQNQAAVGADRVLVPRERGIDWRPCAAMHCAGWFRNFMGQSAHVRPHNLVWFRDNDQIRRCGDAPRCSP